MADDREIWKRISQGNADAFDAFYRENAPRLLVFLRQVYANPQAAEDIVQETFTQIWTRRNGFQPERGFFVPISTGLRGSGPRICGESKGLGIGRVRTK